MAPTTQQTAAIDVEDDELDSDSMEDMQIELYTEPLEMTELSCDLSLFMA